MIFLQKAMVQYTIFKTVLLYLLKVYPFLSTLEKDQVPFLAIFGTFKIVRNHPKKDDLTSILFTVTCNILHLFLTNIMITYFCHSCGSCSYALKYFRNVELMALYAFLAGNDITSFNVMPV